jgi:peptidoglycan/LPS O-acetylase OafA/YrhL
MVPVSVAVCACVLVIRVAMSSRPGLDWSDLYYPTHLRVDALAFGVLLGYLHHYRRTRVAAFAGRFRTALLWCAPITLALTLVFPLEGPSLVMPTVGFTLLFLSFGGLLLAGLGAPSDRRPRLGPAVGARMLAWLGVYSYTIYLAHAVIYRLPFSPRIRSAVFSISGESPWVDRIAFWSLSIVGGVALSHLVERPCLRLRERWLPRTAPRRTPSPRRSALSP